MKTDSQLQHDVLAELEWEPSIDHAHIGVTARDGVITLSGHVSNYLEKLTAERAVRRVAGVRAVAEELVVRFTSEPKTCDDEIAKRVCDILAWDAAVPAGVNVKVEHGWVTLDGEVRWRFQADAARAAAARISGVKGVSNYIVVNNSADPSAIRQKIVDALKRSADVDARSISVATDGGKVILSGTVRAWRERQLAEQAAWSAPGVTQIEDKIEIV